MEKDIGKIKKNSNTDIIIRIDDFGGNVGLTIREFTTSDSYTGFTKSGTRIPLESIDEFKSMIASIKPEDLRKQGQEGLSEKPQATEPIADAGSSLDPILNAPPVANAGDDQIVFNSITLDGSGSFDTDGTISSWNWVLTHRTNHSFDRTATGETPVVSNLKKGFYDVVLTVMDDDGEVGLDEMIFTATGIKKAVVVIPLF